jgi:hypothetical protein
MARLPKIQVTLRVHRIRAKDWDDNGEYKLPEGWEPIAGEFDEPEDAAEEAPAPAENPERDAFNRRMGLDAFFIAIIAALITMFVT